MEGVNKMIMMKSVDNDNDRKWIKLWSGGFDGGDVLVICPHRMVVDPAEMKSQVLFSAVKVEQG